MTIESRNLKNIIAKLGRSSGKDFFNNITVSLSDAISCDYVYIAKIDKEKNRAMTISVCEHGAIVDNFEYDLIHTPCEEVANKNVCCYTRDIISLYPKDKLLKTMKIESYIGVPLYDAYDNVLGLVVTLHTKPILDDEDIITLFELFSTRISLEFERLQLENFDFLTHLYSKKYLQNLLLDNEERVLIIADVNSFSYINEAYGFDFGDLILQKIANILKSEFSQHISVQLDADKFILIYNKLLNIEEKIKEIQYYFSHNIISIDSISMYISFTFGVAFGQENLLRSASVALKKSKLRGRNSHIILDTKKEKEKFLLRESFINANNIVRDAITNDKVIPYFQGIHNNATGEITKFEALVRIEHNDEILLPFFFLEPAKLSGMLPELTKIMIRKSFAIMQKNDYTFSINLTEDDFNKRYLCEYFHIQCIKYDIDPSRVVLEILEGVSNDSASEHIRQLKKLKKMGFKLAIDDFGAEYSNFERLLDLEIDFLKIDAKYIKNIDKDSKSLAIVKAIASFTKSIGIVCIAEFVHSLEVQTIVESLGIQYSQGYLFSEAKPL